MLIPKETDKDSNEAKLFIISGPSGVGKGTIVRRLLKTLDNIVLSVSMTTRKKRRKEIDGKDYIFISKEEFKNNIEKCNLLEYEKHFDNYYGTPKNFVFENLKNGKNVILEIETNGAKKIKKNFPKAVSVFIAPPSIEELKNRIRKRDSETESELKKRILKAREELREQEFFDYCIINDDLNSTF
ncbi:MAG: guanylate kinase, partial [Clostridiales Family XIII bacterium]|nr:guanylate kinase [Clostridiales Family XIII bacterium]